MTKNEAKIIGGYFGIVSAFIGTLIAQTIMTILAYDGRGFLKAFLWLTDQGYALNILVGVAIMFISSYYFGRLAGLLIITKQWNFVFTGFLTGILVITTSSFFASWIGFYEEGMFYVGGQSNPFIDYIFKPVFWVSLFGFIPVLIVGAWFGWRIKRKANRIMRYENNHHE